MPLADATLTDFGATHLQYELNLLLGLAGRIEVTKPTLRATDFGTWVDLMARLETFGLKARLWRDFLYRDQGRPDDVLAVHFAADWPTKRPQVTRELEDAKVRADKLAAHMTTRDGALASVVVGWPTMKIAADVRRRVELLVDMTPASRIDAPTRASLRAIFDEFDEFFRQLLRAPTRLDPVVEALVRGAGGVPTVTFRPPA